MVSNYGRVKSLPRVYRSGMDHRMVKQTEEHILSPNIAAGGYMVIVLSKNAKTRRFLIHRLVGQAFLPNPYNLPQINHKDEDPSNNRADNLEWCDHKYNINYGTRNTRVSTKMTNGPTAKAVLQYTLDGEFVKEWPSTMEIQRVLGFSNGTIGRACRGEYRQSNGYIWRYKSSLK